MWSPLLPVLSFCKCHANRLRQRVRFLDGPLSFRSVPLRAIHGRRIASRFPLHSWAVFHCTDTPQLLILLPPEDVCVVSRFWRLWKSHQVLLHRSFVWAEHSVLYKLRTVVLRAGATFVFPPSCMSRSGSAWLATDAVSIFNFSIFNFSDPF